MPETDFTFTNTSEDAFRETVNRNVAGARLSARLWNLSNGNARNINDVVQGSVRVGRSVTAAGKALLSVSPDVAMVKIPKYVQELKNAADRARALSDNSILQKTVSKYESYINKLTRGLEPAEVRARYAHLGIRGASRMLVKRLQSNTQEVFDSAVDKWVGRKASYQARVVARNETNEAHWLAGQKVAEDKPYVTGFKWNFGSHPRADICNEIKDMDVGMGPGIYPKGQVPARPHPNCFLPGQRILMADGTEKPIENIRVNEMVIGSSGNPCLVLQTHCNKFIGDVFEISTGGRNLILTGNHPIYVAGQGWIEAENIKEGDQIFKKKSPMICPNNSNLPSFGEKEFIFNFISRFLFGSFMPRSSIYLNGDHPVGNGNINIKFIDCEQGDIRKTERFENFTQGNFRQRLTALLLNCFCVLFQALKRYFSSAHSFISGGSLQFSPNFISGGPYEFLSFFQIASVWQSKFNESFGKSIARNFNSFRNAFEGFTGHMSPMSIDHIKDSSILSSNHFDILPYVIVKSRKKKYNGPVYNLTIEKDNTFFAEGILVHNCNCWLSQEFDDDYFKNYTPSPELLQQVRDDPRFPEFKSWAESWLEKTGAGFIAPIIAPEIVPEAVMPIEKSIEDAVNEAYGFGNRTGNEIGIFIDNKTGAIINKTAGTSNYVALGDAYSELKKTGSYTLVHNHPSSASFSSTNVVNLLIPEIKNLVVIGHDGTKYFLSWKKGVPIPENTNRIKDVIENIWNNHESRLMDKYMTPIRKKVDELIASGKMKQGDLYPRELTLPAWKEHSHEIMMNVAKAFEMIYRREIFK